MSQADHEDAFIQAFIRRDLRERIAYLASKPKRRAAFLAEIAGIDGLVESSRCREVPADGRPYLAVTAPEALARVGIHGECYVISEHDGLDRTVASVPVVLESGVPVIASCSPGKLAFIVNDRGGCFICS